MIIENKEGKEWANIEFVGFTDLENNEIN